MEVKQKEQGVVKDFQHLRGSLVVDLEHHGRDVPS